LATTQEKDFVPSLLEAPENQEERDGRDRQSPTSRKSGETLGLRLGQAWGTRANREKDKTSAAKPNYTIDTVHRLKQSFKKIDRLFLLVGIDAFEDIAKWHQAEALFRECAFIVASRPGYSLADVANALPESLRPRPEVTQPFHKQAAAGDLVLSGVTIHLLDKIYQPISSTTIREAASAGKPLGRLVEPGVGEYIRKMGLYKFSRKN